MGSACSFGVTRASEHADERDVCLSKLLQVLIVAFSCVFLSSRRTHMSNQHRTRDEGQMNFHNVVATKEIHRGKFPTIRGLEMFVKTCLVCPFARTMVPVLGSMCVTHVNKRFDFVLLCRTQLEMSQHLSFRSRRG